MEGNWSFFHCSTGAGSCAVLDLYAQGIPAEIITSMLEAKLSFQLVDVLLTHKVLGRARAVDKAHNRAMN
jgi:hypothetical protein